MADVDDVQNQSTEALQVILPFLRIFLQRDREHQLQWPGDAEEVNDYEAFEKVEGEVFTVFHVHQWGHAGDHIEYEECLDVVFADGHQVLVSSSAFE